MIPIREGSFVLSIGSGGRWTYLYDGSVSEEVAAALAAEPEQGEGAKVLRDFARSGTLVMIERFDHRPVVWEVDAGEPLTAREKKVAKWVSLKRVPLDLPSGRLVVDTDDASPPRELAIPKGKYEVALHMVDPREMKEPRFESYQGPQTVLTLRPWPLAKKYNPSLGAIFFHRDRNPIGGPRAPWVGRYRIEGGVFHGEIIATTGAKPHERKDGERRALINLDRDAIDHLGLRPGVTLSVRLEGFDYTVLPGRIHPPTEWLEMEGPPPRVLLGYLAWSDGSDPAFMVRYQEHNLFYRPFSYYVIKTPTGQFAGEDEGFNRLFSATSNSPVEVRVGPAP